MANPGEITDDVEATCRICFDSERNDLISPCLCSGTSKFVHDKCLKTWISSQEVNNSKPKCEICNYEYKMKMKIIKVYNPKKAIEEEFLYCCMIPVIIIIIIILSIIIAILITSTLNFKKNQTFSWLILTICLVPLLFSVVFLMICIKKILFINHIQEWNILSLEKSQPPYIVPINPQNSIK